MKSVQSSSAEHDTQTTSGSLLPMYRAASCGQQRSTNGSKYGMVELVALSFLPGMPR